MEDIDRMIFDSLVNDLHCTFADADEFASLTDLGSEQIAEGIVRCLWKCDPSSIDRIPSYKFPRNPVDRFRIASKISNEIKFLGLREHQIEIGYQTLLYPNVFDSRRIFLALFEKLPKETVKAEAKQLTPLEQLKADVGEAIGKQMAEHWVPEFCRFYELQRIGRFWHPSKQQRNKDDVWGQFEFGEKSEEERTADERLEQQPAQQLRPKPALPPKPKNLPPARTTSTEKETVEERLLEEDDPEMLKLEEQIAEIRAAVLEKKRTIIESQMEISRVAEELQQKRQQQTDEDEEAESKVDERLLLLLDDPGTSLEKLQNYISDASGRQQALEEKFFTAKSERLEQLASKRGGQHSQQQNEQLAILEAKTTALEELLEQRTRIRAKLLKETQKESGNHNENIESRNRFVRRILEISAMVAKQNDEIRRTANSVQSIRREIDQLDGTLDRTFTAVNRWMLEAVESNWSWNEKQMDKKMPRAHKLLVRTHEQCSLVNDAIQAHGQLGRQIDELADRVDLETQKGVDSQLERLLDDLMAIRSENHELEMRMNSEEEKKRMEEEEVG